MDIAAILKILKETHVWTSRGCDAPELVPCAFCGGEADIVVYHPMYGASGAAVVCRGCHARGPRASIYATICTPSKFSTPLLPETLERGIATAIDAWNNRSVDQGCLGNVVIRGAAK